MTDTDKSPGRRGAVFNPEINLGHVLSASTMIVTMIMGWTQLSGRVEMLERQVVGMTQLVERSIRSDARLDEVSRRVQDIEQEMAAARKR